MAQWPISGKDFAELMLLKESNEINDSIAFDALSFSLSEKKKSPIQIIDEKNWKMISDVKLVASLCNDVITSMETENPAVFKKYAPGNRKSSKKIVAKVVGKVYELSGGKMHTAVIKQTVQSL
uniref:Asn/Gln amidotransferase domain-containing protein n=1 Tax=Ciona savignyi TaxID=51511 RepID=H2YI28_CIOSA